MNSIYNLTFDKLEEFLLSIGEKKYRAKQIYEWLYKKKIENFEFVTNISKAALYKISEYYSINSIKIIKKQEDVDVKKYLFELYDKERIEAVLMTHDYGNSICISSQIGCNMGCGFCESGRLKKIRDLDVFEMVSQILEIEKDINFRISHVVIMGIGEPFDNYNNVIDFIKIINHNDGLSIGARHITVSTVGIIPKIKKIMYFPLQVNLAVSLHAPNDNLRTELMPINKVYKINELISVVREYISITNRRVTFEYIMIDNINDKKEHAIELSKLLKGINCYVNLIPYNETSSILYKRSKKVNILTFYDVLKKNNINVTIRREFGSGVDAACGQLRANSKYI